MGICLLSSRRATLLLLSLLLLLQQQLPGILVASARDTISGGTDKARQRNSSGPLGAPEALGAPEEQGTPEARGTPEALGVPPPLFQLAFIAGGKEGDLKQLRPESTDGLIGDGEGRTVATGRDDHTRDGTRELEKQTRTPPIATDGAAAAAAAAAAALFTREGLGGVTEGRSSTDGLEEKRTSNVLSVQTARRLVEAMEQASAVAANAAAGVERVLKEVMEHRKECEVCSKALGDEMTVSTAKLRELAMEVSKASEALAKIRATEIHNFQEALTENRESKDWDILTQRQESLSEDIALLKEAQKATARDLQALNASYLSLEGSIQEQLKRMIASAEEASATNYKLLTEHFRELLEAKMAEIQQSYNNYQLDELAADRSTVDMVDQLKKKGVAVLDISDIFPNYGFEPVRKEFMVRVVKRVRAFFLPVFIVLQNQEDLADWLYTRYHLVPSARLLESIIDELSLVNDREAYAVVRVESIKTEVILRRAQVHGEGAGIGVTAEEAEERQKLQVQSLTEGRLLPLVSQPSQESLVMVRSPFFGAEVIKRFGRLTKTYLRSVVGGHLTRRAVLIIYVGERKGEIARPLPTAQEALRKLDTAERFCNEFSAPSQEVVALWQQMESEVPFYSAFFRVGEFGVVQVQALCRGSEWHIASGRALQAVVTYVNSRPERGGVQALVSIVEKRVTTFWRSRKQHDVQVIIRSADVPRLRLRLALPSDDIHQFDGSKDASKETVVSLPDEEAVQQYLMQAVATRILPSIGPRASFQRLLLHICVSGKTC